MAKKISGSEIVIECLKEQGVDIVFGYPGGAILNVYDALYKHQEEITHVLTSHEQGAAHAADGYARATGKVGVCMATSGPGATNLVTGIATAYMDSVPMVAITANVGVNMLGKDSFQEIDIAGVVMPITKHSFIVKNVEDLAPTIRRAFKIAKSGRPGPVLVDITKDVTAAEAEYTYEEPAVIERKTDTIREEDINKVIEMIKVSRRPYIMAGGGVIISGASEELKEFAEKVDAPVCDTLMGKGAYDGTSERYTGMIGMHGTKVSNLGVSRSDLVIVVGARFSDRVIGNASKFAPNAKIIHIDIDAAEIDKNIPANASIVGDAKEVLTILNSKLPTQSNRSWMAEIKDLTEKNPVTYDMDHLNGPATIKKIYEITEGNAIITTDVGQHQMWASQYLDVNKNKRMITSGGLGTMGFGFPAALGAKMGHRDRDVVCITGDGGFQMNMQEMATAVVQQTPITVCLLNNYYLGMVRQMQQLFYGKRYSMTNLKSGALFRRTNGQEMPEYTPDFVKLAESYGAKGIRVMKKEDIAAAFEEAKKNTKTPTLIEFVINPEELVYPMVQPGGTLEDLIMDC